MKMLSPESKSLMELNNYIWSPPEHHDHQKILDTVRSDILLSIGDRDRKIWSRSPLNVATHKMRFEVVKMMVKDLGLDVNSVDEIKDCQRSALTVAISRVRADRENSIQMINLLLNDLGANVNQPLLWKSPDKAGAQSSSRTFTPLLWAIYQNLPEMVELLLEKGADDSLAGCCLDRNRKWICGNAIGVALALAVDEKIIKMLRAREERRNSKSKTVVQIGNKSDWKRLVESRASGREWSGSDSSIDSHEQISVLASSPDYLSPEEIESEKRALRTREEQLEARIKKSIEIEEQINRLRLESAKDFSSDLDSQSSRESSVGPENLCSIRI